MPCFCGTLHPVLAGLGWAPPTGGDSMLTRNVARSFFGEQEGDFCLALKSLSAVKNESRQPTQAESVCRNEKHSLDKPLPEQKGTEKQEQEQERRSWLSWLGSCFR